LFLPIAYHNSGEITLPLGNIVFDLRLDPGAALIAFQVDDQPIAIATLAWEEAPGLETWLGLVAAHVEELEELKLPVRNLPAAPPKQLPWLAIAFSSDFFDRSSRPEVCEAATLIWCMAQAIRIVLRHRIANN
jgi:hypothetical protein